MQKSKKQQKHSVRDSSTQLIQRLNAWFELSPFAWVVNNRYGLALAILVLGLVACQVSMWIVLRYREAGL